MAWRGVWDEGPWADLHDLVLGDGLIVGWGEGEAAVGSCVVGEELQWNVLLPLAALAEVQAVHAHEPIRAGDDAYHEGQLESGGVGRAGGGSQGEGWEWERCYTIWSFIKNHQWLKGLFVFMCLWVSRSKVTVKFWGQNSPWNQGFSSTLNQGLELLSSSKVRGNITKVKSISDLNIFRPLHWFGRTSENISLTA